MTTAEGSPKRRSTFERFFEEARRYMSVATAVVVGGVLIYCAFRIGEGGEDTAVSLAVLALGFAVGSVLGTALSPRDDMEVERFTSYWRALVAFAGGYLAAKMGPLVDAALASQATTSPGSLAAFRMLGFASTVLIVARVMFACRSYD